RQRGARPAEPVSPVGGVARDEVDVYRQVCGVYEGLDQVGREDQLVNETGVGHVDVQGVDVRAEAVQVRFQSQRVGRPQGQLDQQMAGGVPGVRQHQLRESGA